MNNLPVTVQAIADTTRAAKSLENLTRKREVVLAASIDAKSIASANKPLGAIKRSADEFEKSMAAANARVLAFGTSVAVIEGMRRSFLALIKTTAEVEKSLTQIKVVANDELRAAGISIEKVGGQIFDLAKKTGQSFDATSKSFLEFARQGLKPAQTLERTKTALELVRISGAEQEKVIGGLTAAYNAFSSSGLTFTKIAEKLVNVDNKTTTSVEGLVDVLSRASSTAKLTGTSFEELLAVTATLKDITARSESVIGNAYRSISARLIDPKVLQNLEELGVRTREFDGGPLLKTIGILTNVGEKLKEIADPSLQTEIVKSISGLYQFDQLTALIGALQDVNNLQGFYQKNLRASKEDSDALNQANEAFSNTLINKFNAVDVTIQQVLNSLGKIGVKNPLASLLDGINEIGEGFTKFIDGDSFGSDIAKAFVKGFGGVLLGPTGVVTVGFIIAKIIKDFGVFAFDAAKSFLSLNKTAKDQELIQKSILTTISQMPSILNGIENTESGRLLLAQRVSAEYERQLSLAATLNNIAKGAAQSVYGQGFRITDKGLTKGKRASSGYLPDLISSEMRDIKSGVGGANPNSKIVVMPNFPFGGGKKGLMVANSSEIAMKMGDGYGILNPEMMGQRSAKGFLAGQKVKTASGKYASINNIEVGLENLVQLLVGYEKTLPEIREAAKNFAKSFQLNEKSLDLVVEASVKYASSVKEAQARIIRETNQEAIRKAIGKADQTIRSAPEKRAAANIPLIMASGGPLLNRPSPRDIENALKESSLKMIVEAADAVNQKIFDGILEKRKQIAEYIKKNPPNPLALGLSRTSLPGRDLSGNPTFAYLNQPIRYSGPTSSDPLTRATEIGRQREIDRLATQQRGLSVAPTLVEAARIRQNYQYNQTAAFGGSQRLAAQNLPSSVVLPAEIVNKAKTSLESFAIKTFAASAIVDIVGAQFRGMSEKTDKLIDAFSRATLAVAGFSFLNQRGGVTIGKLFEGAGSLLGSAGKKVGGGIIGRTIGATSSGISTAIGAISTLGKSLVRFLPIIGQISLAGFVVNEFSKVFSDKSIFDRIYQAFGGLSDSAEKAKEKFNEVAAQIFDPSGQYVGRSLEERRGSLSQTRESAIKSLRAQSRGVKVSGKTPQEIEAENFRQLLLEGVGGIETGVVRTLRTGGTGPGPIVADIKYNETIGLLSASAQETILQVLQDVTSGTLEELRTLASSKGIQEIGGIPTAKAERENIQKALAKAFIEDAINRTKIRTGGKQSFSDVVESERGRARISGIAFDFLGRKTLDKTQAPLKTGPPSLSPEVQKNIQKIQNEIRSLIFDGTISALESEIKALEFQASQEGISDARKNRLLNTASDVQQRIFFNQRQQALGNIQARAAEIRSSGKEPEEINAELKKLKIEYTNQRLGIKANEQAAKRETDERNRAADSLNRFNFSLNSIQGFISTLGVRGSVIDAEGQRLRAKASNPSLGILSQENFQRQINQSAIASLENQRAIAAAERSSEFIQNEKIADPNQRAAAEKESSDKLISRNQAIDAEIDAIKESTVQIGSIKSSFTSLNDAILQFSRGLGESRGQNQFNLLQATDTNSIVQGLIGERVYDSAGGKSGSELVSFIADQNALLNEQFKIKTVSNASEKLELERQYELLQNILEIKNKNIDPAQKQLEIEKAINNNLEKRRTFSSGVQDATAGMRTNIQNFGSDFGKTATEGFKDALSGAIKAAVSETDNLKDALLDVALQFANSLRDKAIDNLSSIITNSLFGGGKSSGGSSTGNIIGGILGLFGGVQKRATGGLITGGSGSKDDVPTLLMGGEYVINKKAVQSYGKGFFDSLNRGSVGKMAQGGYFAPGIRGQETIRGKENLLDFATQTATSGKQDIISQLASGAAIISLEPESLRLSNFARFGDSPIINATQEAKDQAFGLYLDQLGAEKDYERQLEEIKKAEKAKKKEFLISLATAVVGAGLSYGASGLGKAASSATKTASSTQRFYNSSGNLIKSIGSSLSGGYGGYGVPYSNAPSFSGGNKTLSSANLLNIGSDILGIYSGFSNNRIINRSPFAPVGGYGYNNPLFEGINVNGRRYNSGGKVSGSGDVVPSMLSNKEFVLNSSATKKIGDKNLYALNNGFAPTGQSQESDEKIIAKLDELIEKTIGASNINITVNTDQSKNDSSSQESGDNQNNQRQLAQKIRETVVGVIREEQRPGGLLTSTRR